MLWKTLPTMEFMQTHWENMAREPKFAELRPAIDCGLQALGKYYGLTDDMSVYVICLGEMSCSSASHIH